MTRPDQPAPSSARARTARSCAWRSGERRSRPAAQPPACWPAGRPSWHRWLRQSTGTWLAGVLVDHAYDWQEDLAAGRYNALVAWASPQDRPEAQRRAVLEELFLGEAARPYFELAQRQFRLACQSAAPAGSAELDAYLDWAEGQTARLAERLANAAARRLHLATQTLFGLG